MTQYRPFSADDAVAGAEAALSRSAGRHVVIEQLQNLGCDERRNIILRASAAPLDGEAQPIIIKATRAAGYDPAAADAFATSGLVKEWAATTLLARRPDSTRQGATLLAADPAQGVLVFTDLGPDLPALVEPLLRGSASDAENALTAHARSLARLHAATIGCQAEHAQIVQTGFPATTVPPSARHWIEREPLKVATLLGAELPDHELAQIAEHLQNPGPYLALVHGDPCPDNVLLKDGTAMLIDFEFSAPGHALLDAVYARMGFPTCWCAGRVPAPVTSRIEQAYRTTLAESVTVATDDAAFAQESALISTVWMFAILAWLLEDALRQDHTWGIATNRARILHYLNVAIDAAAGADILPGIRRITAAWRDQLQAQWPSSVPLALYPAFTTVPDAESETTLRNPPHR
jgi:hypothetical protein